MKNTDASTHRILKLSLPNIHYMFISLFVFYMCIHVNLRIFLRDKVVHLWSYVVAVGFLQCLNVPLGPATNRSPNLNLPPHYDNIPTVDILRPESISGIRLHPRHEAPSRTSGPTHPGYQAPSRASGPIHPGHQAPSRASGPIPGIRAHPGPLLS